MTHTYEEDPETNIRTIANKENLIGYIRRSSLQYGFVMEIEDGWAATKDKVRWFGNFGTRKEAREALEAKDG